MQELAWVVLSILLIYVIFRIEKIIRILNAKKLDEENPENLAVEDHPIIKAAKERMEIQDRDKK